MLVTLIKKVEGIEVLLLFSFFIVYYRLPVCHKSKLVKALFQYMKDFMLYNSDQAQIINLSFMVNLKFLSHYQIRLHDWIKFSYWVFKKSKVKLVELSACVK